MKRILLGIIFSFTAISFGYTQAFITTWKTDNSGTSNDDQITIPTFSSETYLYDVDWGDGTSDIGVMGNITHTYPSAGTYTVTITGTFPRIYFNDSGDRRKILTVEQWGNIAWTSMQDAFEGCTQLEVNATDAPNLSGVTSMRGMFRTALKFNTDINSWDVSTITDMSRLFDFCESFNQPLNSWDVSNVTNMDGMFEDCKVFNQPLDNWDVSNVTRMFAMFLDAESFNQPLNSWDVSGVTIMEDMFFFASAFNQPLDNWDVSNVTSMRRMFDLAESFNQDISGWNVGNVTNMFSMFAGAKVFNQDITVWDISNVTSMGSMFSGAWAFDQNVGVWDISNVNQISGMFNNARAFNQDLSGWDVSGITTFDNLFRGTENFNQDISGWDVSGALRMEAMFEDTKAFNADISGWNVSNVTSFERMFQNAEAFNQDISGWNTASAISMQEMFGGSVDVTWDITGWDVSSVRDMTGMFDANKTFNQDISGWNTISLRFARRMFQGASQFDQDLSGWNVEMLDRADNMFDSAGISIINYDNLLIGWESQTLQDDVTFGARAIFFCEGQAARESIISTYGWTFNDEGLGCITVHEGTTTADLQVFSGQVEPIDFGSTNLSNPKPKNFAIYNNLGAEITGLNVSISGTEFTVTSALFDLAPTDIIVLPITLEATTLGIYTETVTIQADNFSIPFEFEITGEVTPGPEPEIRVFTVTPSQLIPDDDPTPVNIGNTLKKTDFSYSFLIENIGAADLNILSLFTATTNFTVSDPGPITVAPGASQTIDITMIASVEGLLNDLVTLENNDTDESTYNFQVEGFVQGPDIGVIEDGTEIFGGATIDLGSTFQGFNLTKDILITNSGPAELDVNSINITGSSFTFTPSTPFTIEESDGEGGDPGITVTLTLLAGTPGTFSETITIDNSDDDNPMPSFEVTGTVSGAAAPEINLYKGPDPNSPQIFDGQIVPVDLGSATIGNDLVQQLTFQNPGGSDLLINDISISGSDFSITGPIPSSVLAGGEEQISITLSGATLGTFNATVTIDNNDPDESIFDFPITATITDALIPEISLFDGPDSSSPEIQSNQPTEIDFGTTLEGVDVSKEFTISNTGTGILNINSVNSDGNVFSAFNVPSSVAAGAEGVFSIQLSGGAVGDFSETITITSNDADEGSFTFTTTGSVTESIDSSPNITTIDDVSIDEDEQASGLAFSVDDDITPVLDLVITATSDNQNLVPDSQIQINGTAPDYSLVITPVPEESGIAIITVTVNDGTNTTTETFTVTVQSVNDVPEITGQNQLVTSINTPIEISATDFEVQDPDNNFPDDFSVTLINGTNYTVDGNSIKPATDFVGDLDVTVTVSDGVDDSAPFSALVEVVETEIQVEVQGEPQVNGGEIRFTPVQVGDREIQIFTITNNGSIDLVIVNIEIEGEEFQLESSIPGPIPPGESVDIEISFAPSNIGTRTAEMRITSNTSEEFLVTLVAEGFEELPDIEVYNVVSTNNDGKNDFLQINNVEFYPNNTMIIYNRWGNELFRTSGYNNLDNNFIGEDSNGERLPDGTYFYVFEYDSNRKSGFLMLSQ